MSFLAEDLLEVVLQQVHREDQVGGHALRRIVQSGSAVEHQALHHQAVYGDGDRPQHACAAQAIGPAQFRPGAIEQLVGLDRLVARLRLQPAFETAWPYSSIIY